MQQKPGTGSSFVSRPKETVVNPKSKRRASYPRTRAGSSKVPKMSEENVQQENSNIPHDDETVAQGLKAREERSVDSDDAVSQEDEDVEMESEKDATESEEERDPEEVAREAREAAEAAAATHKEAGNKKFKSQDYYGAIDCYTNAINAYPEGSVYYLNRAAARMMVSQFDRAAEDCKECIKLDPHNLKAHLRLGKTLLKRGRLDESIAAFQQALLRDPTNGEALEDKKQARLTIERISRARQLLDEKNFSTALHMVSAGLRVSPDSRQLNLLKAEALVGQGEYDQAYALTTKLMRDSQDDNALLFVRARILYYQENFANAIKHLQQALRSDPDNRKFSNEIKRVRKLERLKESGNAAFKSGRLQEAVEVYGECLQVDPAHKSFCSKLYCNRAAALSKMGRNEEALQDCDKAIELNKEYAKAYNRRAQCLRALGGKENLDRALFDYQQVEQLLGRSREIQQAIRDTKLELKKAKRKDYYGILGLTNRERSTEAEIKKAYKKSALKWHPDRHAGKSEEDAAKAEANFKDVSEAYTLLSDPQKKEQYDQGYDLEEIEQGGGHSHGFGGHGMGGVDPNDIFRMFFGGGGGGVHFG